MSKEGRFVDNEWQTARDVTAYEIEAGAAITRVRAATTTALAANTRTGHVLTADANGALGTIDGVADLAVGDWLLVQDESTGANNGVYEILSVGGTSAKWSMRRAIGWDEPDGLVAMRVVSVSEGTANGNKLFALTTNDPIVLNTTALVFGQLAASAVSNVRGGSVTLVAGVATVADAYVTANSRIALTRTAQGGTVTSTVQYEVTAKTPGASFAVRASVAAGTVNAADTSTLDYVIVESA